MNKLIALLIALLAANASLAQTADPVADFLFQGDGSQEVDAITLEAEIEASLPVPNGVFPSSANLSPLGKALLAVIAHDGPVLLHRYAIETSLIHLEDGTGGAPQPVLLVQVSALNLGAQQREEMTAGIDPDQVAPAEEFGAGPSSSWRLALTPLMGNPAAIIGASRRELSESELRGTDCFGLSCLRPEPMVQNAALWQEGRSIANTELLLPLAHPVAMLELALPAGSSDVAVLGNVQAVVESVFAQDEYAAAAVRFGALEDDSLLAAWHSAHATGDWTELTVSDAFECRRGGAWFAPYGGACP